MSDFMQVQGNKGISKTCPLSVRLTPTCPEAGGELRKIGYLWMETI
jgi:hypothetical protein